MPRLGDFSISRNLSAGIYVDKEKIVNLYKAMKRACKEDVEISIKFTDGFVATSKNVDEIFEDTYLSSVKIKEISLASYNFKDKILSRVDFSNNFFWVVSYDCEGTKAFCLEMKQDIENIINNMKTWYSWIYRLEPYVWIFPIIVIGTPLFIALNQKNTNELLVILNFFSSASISLFVANFLSKLFLPRIIFNIGRGLGTHLWRKKISSFIFTTIIASIIIGIFVNYLSSRFLQ